MLLGLRTYYTSGEKETRAWTIKVRGGRLQRSVQVFCAAAHSFGPSPLSQAGMTAPQAAGVIHGDFERGFIRAETVAYDDLVKAGSEKIAKESGWMRSEGKVSVTGAREMLWLSYSRKAITISFRAKTACRWLDGWWQEYVVQDGDVILFRFNV
jgi:ribosome-binding ATPase YchF (GTP1/OBG family)